MKPTKKIKVIHFVSGFKNGGVEQVLLNYTGPVNKNYDIDELIAYQHEADPKKLALSKKLGNRMKEIPAKRSGVIKHIYCTYKLIKEEKPDIVHAHMSLTNFFPLIVAKFLGVPVRISHSHIAQDEFSPLVTPLFKKLNLYGATNLMACGEQAGKYMYGSNKFKVLYNAIDEKKYSFNRDWRNEIREKYGINKDDFLIGTIGRTVYQKNQKFLVDVFDKYYHKNPQSSLMIIGDGKLSKELDNYIAQKDCATKVIRVKGVKSTEKYYSAFDTFLMPSFYEGLPVVAVEAQASGLTTLLSNRIDKSVKYSPVVKFLSINDGVDNWVDSLKREKDRINFSKEDNNYNIKTRYSDLFNYYEQILNSEN